MFSTVRLEMDALFTFIFFSQSNVEETVLAAILSLHAGDRFPAGERFRVLSGIPLPLRIGQWCAGGQLSVFVPDPAAQVPSVRRKDSNPLPSSKQHPPASGASFPWSSRGEPRSDRQRHQSSARVCIRRPGELSGRTSLAGVVWLFFFSSERVYLPGNYSKGRLVQH